MNQIQKTYNNYVYLSLNKLVFINDNSSYELKLKSSIYSDGLIINKDSFINEYLKFLKEKKISRFFWNKNVLIIYTKDYSYHDKKVTKYIFEDIGYKQVVLMPEINLFSLSKKDVYIVNNKLYYIDDYNKKESIKLDFQLFTEKEIELLLKKRCHNKNVLMINQNKKIEFIIDKLKMKYFYTTLMQELFAKKI